MVSHGKGLRSQLEELVSNLHWSWHPEIWRIFRKLDPKRWQESNHNPLAVLASFTDDELNERAHELTLGDRLPAVKRQLEEYLAKRPPVDGYVGPLHRRPVAYFSAEFGIHESAPLYSGGLGVLAGDHLKSSSDLGLPLIGVGLYYTEGYFKQRIGADGWQRQEYPRTDLNHQSISEVVVDGEPLKVAVQTDNGEIHALVRQVNVGRNRLLLLDCDVPENNEEDRALTSRLYGGDVRTRIRQEMVLGIGGMRALQALGVNPGVVHLNEGHSAFAPLELINQVMKSTHLSFEDAHHQVSNRTVFTTHTPVEAGHDYFTPELVGQHLGPMQRELGLSVESFLGLGRVTARGDHLFCMTVLAFNLARRTNAVSAIHGQVSRKMWRQVWPSVPEANLPIGHVTNGIHVPTFLADAMASVFDRHLETGWRQRITDPKLWEQVDGIKNSAIWEAHNTQKGELVRYLRRRIVVQRMRWGETKEAAQAVVDKRLRTDTLLIGFARRFASYKRATLMFRDLKRMADILGSEDRPVQILFAGKSHPKDEGAKKMLQSIALLAETPEFEGKIIFVEDYDIGVARHLVQGVDLWLNNPRRPMEACGTSGMKGIYNGVLHMSVLDGWWAEAFDGMNGFAIGNGEIHADPEVLDRRDWESLMQVLEQEVVPAFYNRGNDGIPDQWILRVKRAMRTLAWRFTSDRMVLDYLRQAYLPAVGGVQAATTDRMSMGYVGPLHW